MKYTCAHALVALCAVKGMEGERKLDWSHQDVVDRSLKVVFSRVQIIYVFFHEHITYD